MELFPERDPRATRLGGDEDTSPFATDERLHELLARPAGRVPGRRPGSTSRRFRDAAEDWLPFSWSVGHAAPTGSGPRRSSARTSSGRRWST